MKRNFSNEGLVIKQINFGEADRILTIFTRSQGKISVVAKGVRKINSRRAGSLELLNRIKFFAHDNGKLPILTEASSLESFKAIKADLGKLSLAYLMLELIDQFLPEGESYTNLYDQLTLFLTAISRNRDKDRDRVLAASFQIKLLREMGYLPELYRCIRCGKKLSESNHFLSPHLGGLVDAVCSKGSLVGRSIGVDSIKIIRFINSEPVERISQLKLSEIDIGEICRLLNLYTTYHLDRDLGSEKFALEIEKLALSH